MKKTLNVMLLVLLLLIVVSCTTTGRHLYYNETGSDQEISINGTLPLVSIQLSGRTLSWSEQGGNVITNYTFSFDHANSFANMIFDYLPLRDLGISIPAALRTGDVRLTEYVDYKATINNETYDWGVEVVDIKNNPREMDPNILKCLNDNLASEYYLVLDGDIVRYRQSSWFGLIPFTIMYEFSAVVYDNEGNKVFSHHYRHSLNKMPGTIYEAEAYYDGLEIALEQVKDNIISDLRGLGASPAEDTDSFSKGAI